VHLRIMHLRIVHLRKLNALLDTPVPCDIRVPPATIIGLAS